MPLSISCSDPPIAYTDSPYYYAIPASGGTPPYTFSVIEGDLPLGLSLDPATGVISGTPELVSPEPSILHLDPATRNDEGAPIESFWESGLMRGVNEFESRMIRVGNLDIWIRGEGTLLTRVFGPDKTQAVSPPLLSASGVPAVLDPAPGMMYQEKFDLTHVENYTVRVGTNGVDDWWELSEITAYAKRDLFNR